MYTILKPFNFKLNICKSYKIYDRDEVAVHSQLQFIRPEAIIPPVGTYYLNSDKLWIILLLANKKPFNIKN